MSADTIRWGIIGCGDVTEVKSGPALQKAEGSALVAVMRRDAAKAADYAKRHGVPRWYADADALIHDKEVDAVYIATPPGSHAEYALRVAGAGKPCYVEKPMARNHAECAKMVEAFRAKGIPLFVAYYRRALPRFLKAKERIDAGALEKVTGVTYRHTRLFRPDDPYQWRLDPAHSGGGLLLDLGSHLLDMVDYLLGPLTDVTGNAANFSRGPAEDVVSMTFRTPGGAVGSAIWNFAGAHRQDLLEIEGTGGRLEMTCFGDEAVRFTSPIREASFSLPNPPHIQKPLIQTIVGELLGKAGRCPSTGETAARTSLVMDKVLSAYYGSRDDGFWARPETWPGRRQGD
jgi:1,5-anhydro-D-fructose reductase (1,5-anhydro-D-mannitol-forming)